MFKIEFNKKKIDLEIDSAELHLWSSHVLENEKIGLFVNIQTKGKNVEMFDDYEQENYEHFIQSRIYTEWLGIKIDNIKNKNFRTLENLVINFDRSKEKKITQGMIWNNESPGALYVDNHGLFEKAKIEFKYLEKGVFNVKLKGSAEYETPFEVETNIPLQIILKAYGSRETKEDVLAYFNEIFDENDFDIDWKYRDNDIFFKAKPKDR